MRILVAGGTGALGSAVVSKLLTTGHTVRVLSRRPAPDDLNNQLEWMQGNVAEGEGLVEALEDVGTIVNCAGNPQDAYTTDVIGVSRLARAAYAADVAHFFHISIVGIDHIEFDFYQHKLEAEAAVRNSGVPYSIQRLTQFHTFFDFLMSTLQPMSGGYVLPIERDIPFQLIDTYDAAAYVVPLVLAEPTSQLPDVGGPEILRVEELAKTYLEARSMDLMGLHDPTAGFFPPAAVESLRRGVHMAPDNRQGKITWGDYVRRRYLLEAS